MKIKARHSRKAYVQDKTTFARAGDGVEKLFCRSEGQGVIADRPEQPPDGPPDGLVNIQDEDVFFGERVLRLSLSLGQTGTSAISEQNGEKKG